MKLQEKTHIRPKEARAYLGISESTLWLWVKKGYLHPTKITNRVTVFNIDELDKVLDGSIFAQSQTA